MSWADDVREQVSGFAGGTGPATLTGIPVSGEQSFLSGWGASGQGIAKWKMGTQWEIAWCSLNAGGTLITRLETIRSSTGTTTITFSAGVLDITGVAPADWIETRDTEDYLINGNGQVAQRTLGTASDDSYAGMPDRWYALLQTGSVAASQVADREDGTPSMMRLTQSQAVAQRMGFAQIIEGQRCRKLRGKKVTFGGRLLYTNAAAINFAILESTAAVDVLTSDVVNDWTNAALTAGNFFVASNLTVRATGTITPQASAATDFRLSATLGSAFNNLIVMIWTSGTAAQNVVLDIAAQLKRGFVTAPYVFRPYETELQLSQRFFYRRQSISTFDYLGLLQCYSATAAFGVTFTLPVRMRTTPTLTLSAASHIRASTAGAGSTSATAVTLKATPEMISIDDSTGYSGLVAGNAAFCSFNTASGYIEASAEL